ncbi:MAG: AarF/ABC1/UbiB kinase family protein [Acetobacteraceae bacterium]|nr:AarF/ABC1/UbiB kinase family protein [Acetobacteraceae bacterium]
MAERADGAASLVGQVSRLARTTTAVGGIAARVAGARLFGASGQRGVDAGELRAILGGLKGPLMKVAQFLSAIPDALPAEYAAELSQLQANAPPMGFNFVRRRMASELGGDWQKHFSEFGHEAAAAASLGQVHRARLADGTKVACKLQYPDMASVVEADLRQLKLAMALYKRLDNAIDQEEIFKELSVRLREELDYRRESAQMRLYGLMLADQPSVRVPVPVEHLCTGRLLTMGWLDGRPLLGVLAEDPPEEERNRIAEALFRAWYVPLYRYGVIHGDPHPGNYQVRDRAAPDGGDLNLLDFGVIRVFQPHFIRGVIDLYEAVRDNDPEKARHAYETWGFSGLSRETMEVLNLWAQFLYEPLLEDRVRAIQNNDDPDYGRRIVEKVHHGLKRVGGVKPPREFVLMDRAAIGLGSVFLRLRARLNWHRLFHSLIADFSAGGLAARQAAALSDARVPEAA